jgi:hypothetical protein
MRTYRYVINILLIQSPETLVRMFPTFYLCWEYNTRGSGTGWIFWLFINYEGLHGLKDES